MFENWREERSIRKVLKKISKQYVEVILQPGNVWVIRNTLGSDNEEALRTCYLRGWLEPFTDAIPKAELPPDMDLEKMKWSKFSTVYRMTEAGWTVIRRTHFWVTLTCAIAFLTLVATIGCLMLMMWNRIFPTSKWWGFGIIPNLCISVKSVVCFPLCLCGKR
jgi:hypothetical protein